MKSLFLKVKTYFNESMSELKKVNWLSKKEVIDLSLRVIIFSLIVSLILSIFDALILTIY